MLGKAVKNKLTGNSGVLIASYQDNTSLLVISDEPLKTEKARSDNLEPVELSAVPFWEAIVNANR